MKTTRSKVSQRLCWWNTQTCDWLRSSANLPRVYLWSCDESRTPERTKPSDVLTYGHQHSREKQDELFFLTYFSNAVKFASFVMFWITSSPGRKHEMLKRLCKQPCLISSSTNKVSFLKGPSLTQSSDKVPSPPKPWGPRFQTSFASVSRAQCFSSLLQSQ